MKYVFLPELVDYGVSTRNVSGWLKDHELLVQVGLDKILDVQKALELDRELRLEQGKPVLCFSMDEMISNLDPKLPQEFLLKVLEHYREAKAAKKFFEFISPNAYHDDVHLRLIGIHYTSQFWSGWTEVTVQPCRMYQRKYKGEFRDAKNVLALGFHVELKE